MIDGHEGAAKTFGAHLTDESLDSLAPPSSDSLLPRLELSQAVSPWVPSLELDEQFECRLIRMLLEALHHLLPVILKDVLPSAPGLVAEPSIRFWPDDHAACASVLTPQIHASEECFVLLAGKSTLGTGCTTLLTRTELERYVQACGG